MADSDNNRTENVNLADEKLGKGPWGYIIRGMWRSPLGLMGVTLTTVSITLMVIGVIFDMLGLIENPYANIFTYMILPGGMVTGLLLIPIAGFLRRRQWHRFGIPREHLHINLSDHRHRKFMIVFIVLTVINVCVLGIIGYEGYHFTDSPYFCGQVCHQVMAPEYTVYQRSAHSNVACVECHIGPGAQWFVRAKISGLRQVAAVLTDSYSKPIPAPVEHLRPARDTCEHCHWPDKFHGKKVKIFKHFYNDDLAEPAVTEIALHIGGRNPENDKFEGIHWHVSKDVEVRYLATDAARTDIVKVQVKRPDGSRDEFVKTGAEIPEGEAGEWRVMDCIDCHNRPTHIYDMPEQVVDFGLLSRVISRDIPGIREDSLTAITGDYATREEADAKIGSVLMELQYKRHGDDVEQYRADIEKTGRYLAEGYLANCWPETRVVWGTYQGHLGHRSEDYGNYQFADTTFGCFRCHDEEHEDSSGKVIKQECDLCHDEPQ
ncbi:MAG: NapC/NirT family cytochrome c [Proteobacteria bacterium]|nr:NapC/NirT family cytochrome c [Pseudomonadota bacterium]MBU1686700.1 NapC/NirT family cytochrome c [Pseudomonadota bacterium]